MSNIIEQCNRIVEFIEPYKKDIKLLRDNHENIDDVKRIIRKIRIYFDEENRPHDYDLHKKRINTLKAILLERYTIDDYPELWL